MVRTTSGGAADRTSKGATPTYPITVDSNGLRPSDPGRTAKRQKPKAKEPPENLSTQWKAVFHSVEPIPLKLLGTAPIAAWSGKFISTAWKIRRLADESFQGVERSFPRRGTILRTGRAQRAAARAGARRRAGFPWRGNFFSTAWNLRRLTDESFQGVERSFPRRGTILRNGWRWDRGQVFHGMEKLSWDFPLNVETLKEVFPRLCRCAVEVVFHGMEKLSRDFPLNVETLIKVV